MRRSMRAEKTGSLIHLAGEAEKKSSFWEDAHIVDLRLADLTEKGLKCCELLDRITGEITDEMLEVADERDARACKRCLERMEEILGKVSSDLSFLSSLQEKQT